MTNYEKGELVWAKIIGFPWWPGIVISYIPKVSQEDKSDNVIVNFIGENTHAYLNDEKIRKYSENFEKFGAGVKSKKLKDSILAANVYLKEGNINNFINKTDNKTVPQPNILNTQIQKQENSAAIEKKPIEKNNEKKKMILIKKKVESKQKEKIPEKIPLEVKNINNGQKKVKAETNEQIVMLPSKKIKKKKKPLRKLMFSLNQKKSIKTSSTFLIPTETQQNEGLITQNNFNFMRNEQELKQILHDLTSFLSSKYNDERLEGEKEKIVKRISEQLVETLNLIDEALKQEHDNMNRNTLLNLLKEGYGKYIASIMKIFEAHQPYLSEIFTNFNQKFSDIYNRIKNYFFHRYLFIDKKFMQQIKEEVKNDPIRKKSMATNRSKSFSLTEDEILKELIGDSMERKNSEDSQSNELIKTLKNEDNLNDENMEIRHFRKKFCVKIARILQTQYGYEKQKSHDITIKIEKKLRKEFPNMNSDYKTNGMLLLNLLKNNSMDILKLIEDLDELEIGNIQCENETYEMSLKDKRSNSV